MNVGKTNNAITTVEVNSIGDVIFEQLKKLCRTMIQPFVTTAKSKQDAIEKLGGAVTTL